MQVDPSAVQRGNRGGEGQAESVSGKLTRCVEPGEALEDPRFLVGRDAGPVIGHFDADPGARLCGADTGQARPGSMQRDIVKKIGNHLLQQLFIAAQGETGLDLCCQGDAGRGEGWFVSLRERLQKAR